MNCGRVLLSVADVAEILGIGPPMVRCLVAKGELRVAVRVKARGTPQMRFDPAEVERLRRLRARPLCGFCEEPMDDPVPYLPREDCRITPLVHDVCGRLLEQRVTAVKAVRGL